MTAVAAMSTRQPFGAVDVGRLYQLESTKNLQNGMTSARGAKRAFLGDITPAEDTENVDPSSSVKSTKRVKGHDGISVSKLKAQIALKGTATTQDAANPVKTSALATSRRIKTPTSRMNKTKTTAELYSQKVDAVTAATVPTPAGRSPKSKRIGILRAGRTGGSPFARVNPPSFMGNMGSGSIDAALSATLPVDTLTETTKAPIQLLDEKPQPKGWFFQIREDSLEETLTNMMEHSTNTLDISDDEGRDKAKDLTENKENIAPADYVSVGSNAGATGTPSTKATGRNRSKPLKKRDNNPFYRAPLGDIPVAELYEDAPTFVPGESVAKTAHAATTGEDWPLDEDSFKGFQANDAKGKGKAKSIRASNRSES